MLVAGLMVRLMMRFMVLLGGFTMSTRAQVLVQRSGPNTWDPVTLSQIMTMTVRSRSDLGLGGRIPERYGLG